MLRWVPRIGIEVHCRLKTSTKLFSNMMTPLPKSIANTCVSLYDASIPGSLPSLNLKCVDLALLLSAALKCHINSSSYFERKHYIYQDLPLGYQITQHKKPIAEHGILNYESSSSSSNGTSDIMKSVGITRIQIEQDTGKTLHDHIDDSNCIDLNRAGCGLLEIVMEPTLKSGSEVVDVVKTLQQLMRHIGVCDGNMEDGSLRIDVNISISNDDHTMGDRVELKNLNSFDRLQNAVEYERSRQISLIEAGSKVLNETRGYDVVKNETYRLRSKESIMDYRFMPDPDLPPLKLSQEHIDNIVSSIGELPHETHARLLRLGLSDYQIQVLMKQEATFFFDQVCELIPNSDPQRIHALITTDAQRYLVDGQNISESHFFPYQIATLITLSDEKVLTGPQVKKVISVLNETEYLNKDPEDVAKELGVMSANNDLDDSILLDLCQQVVNDSRNKKQLKKFCLGKKGVIKFFMGEVMRTTLGAADPAILQQLLEKVLNETCSSQSK